MPRELGITSRRSGRLLAGLAAVGVLGLAVLTAVSEAAPELHIYDGLWMITGAALLVSLCAPLVWNWPRERALAVVASAAAIGAWAPLVVLALRAGVPVMARLKGAVFFSDADILGIALPVGVALGWLALKEHTSRAAEP
jgi:hypothetical protein